MNIIFLFAGDSGYPLRSYMMTPIGNVNPDPPESHYTNMQNQQQHPSFSTQCPLKHPHSQSV